MVSNCFGFFYDHLLLVLKRIDARVYHICSQGQGLQTGSKEEDISGRVGRSTRCWFNGGEAQVLFNYKRQKMARELLIFVALVKQPKGHKRKDSEEEREQEWVLLPRYIKPRVCVCSPDIFQNFPRRLVAPLSFYLSLLDESSHITAGAPQSHAYAR